MSGTAALSRGYRCDVSGTPAGLAFPVREQIYTSAFGRRSFLQCQQRYLADCSFEVSMLIIDTTFKCVGLLGAGGRVGVGLSICVYFFIYQIILLTAECF